MKLLQVKPCSRGSQEGSLRSSPTQTSHDSMISLLAQPLACAPVRWDTAVPCRAAEGASPQATTTSRVPHTNAFGSMSAAILPLALPRDRRQGRATRGASPEGIHNQELFLASVFTAAPATSHSWI